MSIVRVFLDPLRPTAARSSICDGISQIFLVLSSCWPADPPIEAYSEFVIFLSRLAAGGPYEFVLHVTG